MVRDAQFVEEFAAADRRINRGPCQQRDHRIVAEIRHRGGEPHARGVALVVAFGEQGLGAAVPVLGALVLGAQRLLPLVQQVYNGWAKVAGHWLVTLDVLRVLQLPAPEETDSRGRCRSPFETKSSLSRFASVIPDGGRPHSDHISFSIPRGSRLAIVGRTGSGKSTLADLLMGLLEPTRQVGFPLIDSSMRRHSEPPWQRSIAHVPQSAFLADTSIARNIAFGMPRKPNRHRSVRAAARYASSSDFVAQLAEGYDTRRRAWDRAIGRTTAAARHRPRLLQGCACRRA